MNIMPVIGDEHGRDAYVPIGNSDMGIFPVRGRMCLNDGLPVQLVLAGGRTQFAAAAIELGAFE